MTDLYYTILEFLWRPFDMVRGTLEGTHTYRIFGAFWELASRLWYYVLIGSFAAVLVGRVLPRERVRRFLEGNRGLGILVATLLGVISPMCTFAAIPLVAGLIATGIPAPPLIAFLISSPLMNPSLFVMTWGVIGPEMALARLFAATVLGLLGGTLTHVLSTRVDFVRAVASGSSGGRSHSFTAAGGSASRGEAIRAFSRDVLKMSAFVGKYFFLALLIAAVVQVVISPQWIARLFGGRGFLSAVMGGLLGVPLYACGGGTVATISVLITMGMGQGAALAFFLAGPATKISTILTMAAVMRRKVTALYLCVTLIGGILLGYGYSVVAPDLKVDARYYGKLESVEDAVLVKPGATPATLW